jgi:hypothetical protein
LKLNFYAQPDKSLKILSSLKNDGRASGYVQKFTSVNYLSLKSEETTAGVKDRATRKIQIYWAILKKLALILMN